MTDLAPRPDPPRPRAAATRRARPAAESPAPCDAPRDGRRLTPQAETHDRSRIREAKHDQRSPTNCQIERGSKAATPAQTRQPAHEDRLGQDSTARLLTGSRREAQRQIAPQHGRVAWRHRIRDTADENSHSTVESLRTPDRQCFANSFANGCAERANVRTCGWLRTTRATQRSRSARRHTPA